MLDFMFVPLQPPTGRSIITPKIYFQNPDNCHIDLDTQRGSCNAYGIQPNSIGLNQCWMQLFLFIHCSKVGISAFEIMPLGTLDQVTNVEALRFVPAAFCRHLGV